MEHQRTIQKEVSIAGAGLHSGKNATLKFKPASENSGINFIRLDLPDKPRIKASVDNILSIEKSPRRTSIGNGVAEVQTVEHLMSALCCLRIDNLDIEIDQIEIPGLDGSGLGFIEILEKSGIKEQNFPKKVFSVKEPIWVEDRDASIVVLPYPGYRVSYTLDYDHPQMETAYLSFDITEEILKNEIAPSRTFCLEEEVRDLRQLGLGQGANYKNTLVVGKKGVIENKLRFQDEFIRHKILDLIGDFYLFGPLRGHVVALKSGHPLNIKILLKLNQQKKRIEASGVAAVSNHKLNLENPIEISDIQKILPHRYPFLLVDRIISLEPGKRAVGIKNVTVNEHFFVGHFPQRPVMPGVLIVEAMAQVGGVVMLSPQENRGKIAFFMSANNIKFRRPVVPGDQLRLEVEVAKVRSKTGLVKTRALVEDRIVAEADLMFSLADK